MSDDPVEPPPIGAGAPEGSPSAPADAAAEPSSPSGPPPGAVPEPVAPPQPAAPAWPEWAAAFRALATTPLAGADATGESVVRDPAFEALEVEIKKPEQIQPRPVDWGVVEGHATALLATRTKDIKVAAYLAVAAAEKRGARGHALAALLVNGLATTFGGQLWPRRLRGRNGALEWAGERLVKAAEKLRPNRLDEEPLRLALQEARASEASCKAAFEEPGQELEALRHLRKWASALERQLAEAAKVGQGAPGGVSGAAKPQSEGFSIESVEDARRAGPKLRALIGKCAEKWRAHDPSDPSAYRAARFALWPDRLPFEVAPDGQTPVPMLDPAAAEARLAALVGQPAAEALAPLEALFLERPWWLDVQRVLAQKLEALGEAFAPAAATVTAEAAAVVRRLPKLLECSFRSGVPFVGAATRAWLEGLSGGGPGGAREGAGDDPLAEIEAEASAAGARRDLRAALGVYQRGLGAHASPRAQFVLRLGLARTCLKTGHPELALPHLEELRAELARCSLGEWDPGLAVDVLAATVTALRAAAKEKGANPELRTRAAVALGELSRLDPLVALELGP